MGDSIKKDASIQQSYYLLANDYDLSFLDVEEFNIQFLRIIIGGIWDRDTGDDYNSMSLESYQFDGTIKIDYEYNLHAVPIPSAIWLLGSGLIGLVGIRRQNGHVHKKVRKIAVGIGPSQDFDF